MFMIIMAIGQLIFTISMFMHDTPFMVKYPIAIAGRFIIGAGASSLSVLNNVSIAQWFFMQEYAFAIGIFITIGRFGTVTNNFITGSFSSHIGYASLVGFLFLVMSIVSGFIFIRFGKHAIEIEL